MPENTDKIYDPFDNTSQSNAYGIIKTDITPINQIDKKYENILELLLKSKKTISSVPTHIPRNMYEQIEFYENDTTRKLYIFINGVWYSTTLT